MASTNSSLHRRLPATPGAPTTAAPSSPTSTSARPTSSSSHTQTSERRGSKESNRLSMQPSRRSSNVPRPAPIPIPEPIVVSDTGRPSHSSSSGEGAPSTDSMTASQELDVARAAMAALHANSNGDEDSPSTSPRETNNLLADGELTPRSNLPSGRPIPRPRSAVETGAAMHDSGSRPHSSTDAWSTPRPASANVDALGYPQSPPGTTSRSHSPSADSLLRPTGSHGPMPRSRSSGFISSPLNPSAPVVPRRPGSSASRPPSMVLYRLAGIGDDFNPQMSSLAPPVTTNSRRASRFSTMSSTTSIVSDSKYPLPVGEDGTFTPPPSGAFLPYEYDPTLDLDAPDDAEDALHAPDPPGKKEKKGAFGLRGVINVCVIFTILASLIVLFAVYPIISYYDEQARTGLFTGSTTTTNNGDDTPARTDKDLVDPDTPEEAKSWSAPDGTSYKLVFSDEFKKDKRKFGSGDDPFWEAVDLYDGKNGDLNYYDSGHVTTKDGHLVITLEEKESNGRAYTSGMLQSWNKFCFTGGYIEVSVSLPGTSQNLGFMPQAYTMGNLARAGYPATEEGVFPYTYNTCDNSALAGDGSLTTNGQLPGQRLSACTCDSERQNGQHPGPRATTGDNDVVGRGAPQIDILGALSQNGIPGEYSQSLRMAPFNEGQQVTAGVTYSAAQQNFFTGVPSQQVVSGVFNPPTDSYDGTAFSTFGYEHVPNTQTPASSAIYFSMDGAETWAIQGSAFPAVTGGELGQRLISNEPMYIVLSLALSELVVQPATTGMTFPAKFLVDYVRVYQPSDQASKVTCDPSDFPTSKYIEDHPDAYNDPTKTSWVDAGYTIPGNHLTGGC